MEANEGRVSRPAVRLPAAHVPPLVRRSGRTAKEAQLRARYEVARVLGDAREEHAAARALAERLAAREVELDVAVELALKTLSQGDNPELRHALAGWLEGLGEPGLAASELRKLVDERDPKLACAMLVKVGVLHARAGDAQGADEALSRAASRDESDPLPLELLGAIAGWAPDVMPPRAAAEAYVRAAKRRASAGEGELELEDLLRAFELDPSSPLAAAALALAHQERAHATAADEVLRAHAHALGTGAEASEVHARRRTHALAAGDLSRALAAALDEGLDASFDGESADAMDDLLVRANAYEPVAVRLAIKSERASGRAAAQRWAELGRLLAGPLAAPERALEAYARAVAIDATHADALQSLRAISASAGSRIWLVEGLVRGALVDDAAARVAAARALAEVLDAPDEATLAAWAQAEVVRLDPGDERARAASSRLGEVLARHEEELALARRAVEVSADAGRRSALAELARLLRSAPAASRELAKVLADLTRLDPNDDTVRYEAMRVAERIGDLDLLESLCRDRLARPSPPPRVRIALVSVLRRKGDTVGAANVAKSLFDAVTPSAYSVAWIAAAAAGDKATRAQALAALGPICSPKVVSVMTSTAAEELAREGDLVAARRAAEQACKADPEDARALRVLAEIVRPSEGRVATAALERAIAVAGPASSLCARLSDAHEHLGNTAEAVQWARRVVALRPGDDKAVRALVDRATHAADTDALAEALSWLVLQPRPGRQLVEAILPALRALSERDAKRAAQVCARALEVLGPRHPPLRVAIDEVAAAAGDARLRATLGERWIAAGAPAAERGSMLFALAAYYAALGDTERELLAYARAARVGEDLSRVAERIRALDPATLTPDGELSLLEARAELYLDEGRTDVALYAFRDLGAALWDCADDRPHAVQAWLRAAQLDSVNGYAILRRDLIAVADAEYATNCLAELVEREEDGARAGIIATEAARAALQAEAFPRALALARTALDRDPKRTEALQAAEGACAEVGRVQEMSPIYDQVAKRALGRFGRRAAHHRAARFFESSGVHMMALKHAAQAFIAVPSEGSTLGLLARTADRAQRRAVAVRTLEHVAETARTPGQRAAWLIRGASMAGNDLEGARQRVDLLLKAIVLSANPTILSMLASAAKELVGQSPDDAVALATRLERASDSLAKGLEGPDGARMGIAFAEMAIELFRDAAWGWRALEQATGADGDIEEYVKLIPHADALGKASGAAEAVVRLMDSCEKPYANIGHSLLRLVGALAYAVGDKARRARALVTAAEKEPDDDQIVADAEDAVAEHPDEALAARLSKKVDAGRRSEALRSVAKKVADQGDAPKSVRFLERAWIIAPVPVRREISQELKSALMKAGRGEEALARDLEDPDLPPEERADRWAEVARLRKEKDDKNGVTEALYEAAQIAPSRARWAAVEDAADKSRHEDVRVEALRTLVPLVDGAERLAVMKRLARAEGARGDLDVAQAVWREVWAADPKDGEADVAIEALLVARGAHEELATHLAKRAGNLAQDPASAETLRAVRLRRAALLEQRLGRLDDAAAELEQLLREVPGHASALRWLADLHERMGHAERALPALDALAQKTNDDAEHQTVEIRRIRALLASGDVERAHEAVKVLGDRARGSREVLELRVEVGRASDDAEQLGDALAELAKISSEDALVRSDMLIEASQCAARAGNTDASLTRARDAASLAPDAVPTQLFARGLEYRLRGAGNAEEAQATIASLGNLSLEGLEPEDLALRAFLLAEAEDVIEMGRGERTLRACVASVGVQPLVALGLAERAAAEGRFEEALAAYGDAVSGNLLGLRRPGFVALAAADAAEGCAAKEALLHFLAEAAKDDEVRADAAARLAGLPLEPAEIRQARALLRNIAESFGGEDRAAVLARIGRTLFDSEEPAERLEADRTMRDAIKGAPAKLAEELQAELEGYRSRVPVPTSPSMAAPARKSMAPPPLPAKVVQAPVVTVPVVTVKEDEPVASIAHPPLPAEPPRQAQSVAPPSSVLATSSLFPRPIDFVESRIQSARERLAADDRNGAEMYLAEALRGGSLQAADMLDELLVGDKTRTALLTKIRRQAAELRPGDPKRLAALLEAARADQNVNYARAIEHVMRAFDKEQGPLPPPPLSAQSTQPGILALLTRHSREPGGEAFGIVWEGAQSLFVKPPAAYGTTGLERVVPGGTTGLARLYEVALRLLDVQRFTLFHRRGPGILTSSVALLTTPSAILAGHAGDDSSDLRWLVGQALAASIPQNTLPLAMMESEGRALWNVLVGAFGPPGKAKLGREHAALAEMLWQTLAPKAQRRLKELLAKGDDTPYDLVVERARQGGRRIGMFLTGDFAHATRRVLAEARNLDINDMDYATLRQMCIEVPALADLIRLAIRPEYADARWHMPAPTSQRMSITGRLPAL